MEDATIIKKCLAGEPNTFGLLVERYQNQAVGHAVAILGNRDDALDAVQQAFIDAFRSLGRFDPSRTFYPWFYVLIRNRCYKLAGQRRQIVPFDETELLAPQSGQDEDQRILLETALRSLSPDAREIITLKYLDGLTYRELAEHLQIPEGTVMSRLFHARKQLQVRLTSGLSKKEPQV